MPFGSTNGVVKLMRVVDLKFFNIYHALSLNKKLLLPIMMETEHVFL